jgi:hypothetical protein
MLRSAARRMAGECRAMSSLRARLHERPSRRKHRPKAMSLYIWEGDGISDAYHDDGTLVILAETPEQAREVVARARVAYDLARAEAKPAQQAIQQRKHEFAMANGGYRAELWQTPEGKALIEEQMEAEVEEPQLPDGSAEALAREPDRIVELDEPTIVAFNGGGYD